MAKTKMICPFSRNLCVECGHYRGRHYYLCFCKTYRGYLGEAQGIHESGKGMRGQNKFDMPPVIPRSSSWLILDDIMMERKGE